MSILLQRLFGHGDGGDGGDVAIVDDDGRAVTYGALRARAAGIAARLRGGRTSLDGAPVAFLIEASATYVAALLGVMRAGGTAVPLSPLHTGAEIAHLLATAAPEAMLATAHLAQRAGGGGVAVTVIGDDDAGGAASEAEATVAEGDPALMLFTSGTTGKPKGVTMSHGALAATLAALEQAWGWRGDDRLLHVLPLHHTHGVVVALMGGLWAGARVRFAAFEAARVWALFADSTVFMAVPTIYAKLLEAFGAAPPAAQSAWRAAAQAMRLLTSGSAALPASLFRDFAALSGQSLLERYGMTEIGMALSNPLGGPRIAGAVGRELPGVQIDIVGDDGRLLGPDEPGELRVRSPQMFSGYHGDPAATARAFDDAGRFRTGDTGVRDAAGIVRLLGRTSTDIIKSGGYKLSALEIESVLRDHPAIAEVAVIGLPDATWGEQVTACVVLRAGAALTVDDLRAFARDRLAPYKLPRALRVLPSLPKTALGKVQKGPLIKM